MSSPQYGFDVVVSLDGEEWCALIGPNLQDGIAGFGANQAIALRALAYALDGENDPYPDRGSDEELKSIREIIGDDQ